MDRDPKSLTITDIRRHYLLTCETALYWADHWDVTDKAIYRMVGGGIPWDLPKVLDVLDHTDDSLLLEWLGAKIGCYVVRPSKKINRQSLADSLRRVRRQLSKSDPKLTPETAERLGLKLLGLAQQLRNGTLKQQELF